jgi:hypothetical protein
VNLTAQWHSGPRPIGPKSEVGLTTYPYPVPLNVGSGTELYLAATQAFHFERRSLVPTEWKVSTDEYIYNVGQSIEDARDYLFAWHWHPSIGPEHCHVHVRATLLNGMSLAGTHLPTARVTFEEVIRFLVGEFDVIQAREDWLDILADTQARHEKHRSWAGSAKPAPDSNPT